MGTATAETLADDFPELAVHVRACSAPGRPEGRHARKQLAALAARVTGASLLAAPTGGVPSAYRAFARQIGLDPDVDRGPLERLVVERLMRGRFPSHGPLADALAAATIDSGVPLWAVDLDRVRTPLWVGLQDDELVVADVNGPVAPLLGDPLPHVVPERGTRALLVYALRVPGVPAPVVEDALWRVAGLLEPAGAAG